MITPPPPPVRRAAVLVAAQGLVGVVGAVVFTVRGLAGADRHIVNGFGTAIWFAGFGAALLAAGWALRTGRRWGRGLAVYAQMLLLPVSWYAGVGSHRWWYAVALAAVSVTILALLFSPAAIRWLSGQEASGRDDAASADSSGPDTR